MSRLLKLAGGLLAVLLSLLALGCAEPYRPQKVLMVVGGAHHDYVGLPVALASRLNGRGDVSVEVTDDLPALTAKTIAPYRVLIFNTCHRPPLNDEIKHAILDYVRAGNGLVVVHCSLWSYYDWPEWTKLIGGHVETHDKYGTYEVVVLDPGHATMLSLGNRFMITDEPYLVDERDPDATVLVETAEPRHDREGRLRPGPDPQVWVKRHGQGRIFVTTFGHDAAAQESESFLTLLHNGIRWAAGLAGDTVHNKLTKSEEQAGFELLFNGRDLAGWRGDPMLWKAENGELVGRAADLPRDSMMVCGRPFRDFVLRLSFRLIQGNSGVQVRSVEQPSDAVRPLTGPQVELVAGKWGSVFDYGAADKRETGGLLPADAKVVVDTGWNNATIEAVGSEITVTINGLTTARFRHTGNDARREGLIGFQLHRGDTTEIRFRDIRIRARLPKER
ncbi:MAG: ThuA domain-containing protein [Planctomycetes bacterium]|nr:ThuA domain-containing protein [Planctomycetota bacterium]